MRLAGLLLAAGAGRRMGLPKGLVRDTDGQAWVTRSAQVLITAGCDPVLVVVGARAQDVAALVPAPAGVVVAADWDEGMGASLRAGLAALASAAGPDVPAVIVALVDTPGVGPLVVQRLAARARTGAASALARAAYHGQPGHPVLLGRAHWPGVAATARGDAGARAYLAAREVALVECGDLGDGRDIDAYSGPVSSDTDVGRPHPSAAHPGSDAGQGHRTSAPDTRRITPAAHRVARSAVTRDRLDVAAHETAVAGPVSGAVVTFCGVVRDHDGGRAVTSIEYVGHPQAGDVLAEVAAEVAARCEVEAVAVSHRLGQLEIGDAALVVAVSGAHRQETFAAAALLVEEVKHRLPVWKRQVFTDGTDEWVACP